MYNISFLILCVLSSPGIVLASDDLPESSADLHIRRKRMDPSTPATPASSPSHQLPPFLAYNLRAINTEAPTVVTITRDGNIIGSGYAIHPYLILTRSVYARPQYELGVSTRKRYGEGHIAHGIQRSVPDTTGEFVIIQLLKPIFLDEPVHGALTAAKYPASAINWADHEAMQWIPGLMSTLRPILIQNLNEVNFVDPAKVHVLSSERPSPGNGFAVHPYIVITRPEFVTRTTSVMSFTAPTGDSRSHRIQSRCSNRALNVEALELLDPILMADGDLYALTHEDYSAHAIAWARSRADEWKRTRLNQRNFHGENAA